MLDLVAENSVLRLVLLVLLFALVAASRLLVGAKYWSEAAREAPAGRSRRPELSNALPQGRFVHERIESAWLKLVNSIESRGLSLVDTKDVSLRQKLIAAGFTATYAPRLYTLIRLTLVVITAVAGADVSSGLPASSPSMMKLYFSLVIAAAVGLYFPALFIRAKADRRQQALVNAFPDALDLMLVCVEAGLGSRSRILARRNGNDDFASAACRAIRRGRAGTARGTEP